MGLKAWYVSDKDGYGYIVFTETRGKARVLGMYELERDFIDVNVKRERKYDEYAEKGYVPIEVLLKDGWRFECCGCYSMVTVEDVLRGGLVREENVYCTDCVRWLKEKQGA
jgi:hypothetical protein